MNKAIGILGGTFDPIHNGHLFIASQVQQAIGLTTVHFVLNKKPPHRHQPAISAKKRQRMLELALAGQSQWVLDSQELDRAGPSYSLWTMRALRHNYGATPLIWITGMDAWLGLKSWFRWEEMLALVHFAVVPRTDYDLHMQAGPQLSSDISLLHSRPHGHAVLCEIPLLDVSASLIRENIKAGENVSQYLPAPVLSYIKDNHFYD